LAVLADLVDRAGKVDPTTGKPLTFGEFPEILSAYLAARAELGAPPKKKDLLAAKQKFLHDGIELAVGKAEKEKPAVTQQAGASADSVGTTTLVEKAGIADLINLAIERGAIIETTSGTSFTLQTTPYMIFSQFGGNDTEDNWKRLTILRQIGISATFNQSEGADVPTKDNFESGELKYTFGNRSPRDKVFLDNIRKQLEDKFTSVDATARSLRIFRNSLSGDAKDAASAKAQFNEAEKKLFPNSLSALSTNQQGPIPADQILAALESALVNVSLKDSDRDNLNDLVDKLTQEANALAAASEIVTTATQAYLDAPHPQFSLAYTYQRDPEVSDFSVFKGLFGYKADGKLSANFNGEVMVNNNRTDVAGQALDRIRAYSVEAGLTLGKFANDALDFTAGGKWIRPMGESRDIRSFQAKLNLYLKNGITLPFSLTYANDTVDPNSTQSSGKSRVRLNVGFALTGDALMGVARRAP